MDCRILGGGKSWNGVLNKTMHFTYTFIYITPELIYTIYKEERKIWPEGRLTKDAQKAELNKK